MNWGVLDEPSFRQCCQLLLQQSEQLGDGWSWEEVQGSGEGYLKKVTLRSVVINLQSVWNQEGLNSELDGQDWEKSNAPDIKEDVGDVDDDGYGDGEEDDAACLVTEGSRQVLQYEYHILYSCSYGTPVLYFRAFNQEGRSLTLEEVWSSVHPNFRLRLQASPLNTISMQEHPLLGQPFFMVHPCKTEAFMRPVLQAAHHQDRPVNYVLSWLSMVAPLVGLEMPLQYSTLPQVSSTKPD